MSGGDGFLSFIGIRIRKAFARIVFLRAGAHVAQLVERVLGKDEVISSILIMGSIFPVKSWGISDSSSWLQFAI